MNRGFFGGFSELRPTFSVQKVVKGAKFLLEDFKRKKAEGRGQGFVSGMHVMLYVSSRKMMVLGSTIIHFGLNVTFFAYFVSAV